MVRYVDEDYSYGTTSPDMCRPLRQVVFHLGTMYFYLSCYTHCHLT